MRYSPTTTCLLLVVAACSPGAAAPGGNAPVSPSAEIPAGPYVPGQSYFGRRNYIEYIGGNAPVIFTASHGGALIPDEIPDRTASACGGAATTVTDLNTIELVRAMQQRYFAKFGKYPHVVITHLSRKKLDSNRTLDEAACGDLEAQIAYSEFHAFIDAAEASVLASFGRGFYMDMHGHGHAIPRLELGYLLTDDQLNLDDPTLDLGGAYEAASSVRTLSSAAPASFSSLLRGELSLGTLYAANGFRAVPSSAEPRPGTDPYFNGGENTRRHACSADGGTDGLARLNICGVQIESNLTGVRDTDVNRQRFGDVTAAVLQKYLAVHWNVDLAR